MKRTIVAIIAMAALLALTVACSSAARAARKAEAATYAADIKKAFTDMEICVMVTQIIPQSGSAISSTDGYKIRIHDGKVTCRLPFFGSVNTTTIGDIDQSIVFEETPMQNIQRAMDEKGGEFVISFEARNSAGRMTKVAMDIFDNGVVRMSCDANGTSHMGYTGEVVIEK